MTGKDLKTFAATVADHAVIEVRERTYLDWSTAFILRAVLDCSSIRADLKEE